jgi:hypothetical protein
LKKPLAIDAEVLRRLSALPREQRSECLLALCDLAETFGKPHLHSGLSIRKIRKTSFECRGNIHLRFIFHDRPNDLYVSFLGDHNEVRAALKSGRFD